MTVMTNTEFVSILKKIATEYKTLYVMGCFGAPMTDSNKNRYCNYTSYNKQASRQKMIKNASADTFGFDCVCLVKGVLWGWNGDKNKTYGGALYVSNGVPDIDTETMIAKCRNVSTDFSNIEIGECLWMQGHIGVYIGDGLAVECTPAWKNKVQITAVKNIGTKSGYNARQWTKHGKLPYITYKVIAPNVVLEWQKAAIADGFKFAKYGADGEWGAECEGVATKAICKKRLTYTYKNLTRIVQKAVGTTVDGLFGNNTKNAVIQYQKNNGLVADGEVGINTWKKILGIK